MSRLPAPRLIGAFVLAVVLTSIAVGLGFWQLSAWSAEREAEAVDLTQEAPVAIGDVIAPGEGFPVEALGRPVTVEGTWRPERTLVVTGRSTDTEAPGDGAWAVTPLAVAGVDADLLVVRGWAASPDDLGDPPSGEAELVVRMQPSQADEGVTDATPGDRELPQLRIADAIQLTDATLYGGYGVADGSAGPDVAPGLEEVTVPPNEEVGPFTALQNLLYAIEWWVFGAFAAFVWWRFARDARDARRATSEEEAGEAPSADEARATPPSPVGSSS